MGQLGIVSEQFSRDTIIVNVGWEGDRFTEYSIEVSPASLVNETSQNSTFQLEFVILYNVNYTVMVTASHCGHNASEAIKIRYGEIIIVS